MDSNPATRPASHYAGLRPGPARLVLAVAGVALVVCIMISEKIVVLNIGDIELPSMGDGDLYRAVARGVHDGEGYYAVVSRELGAYPGMSVFNWRLPTYAWLLGALPDPDWARWVFAALAYVATALAAALLTRDAGTGTVVAAVVLLGGAFIWCAVYDNFLFTELWAGLLILLSVGARGVGWRGTAVAAGLLALFLRELALPYVLVAAALAGWEGRRRECLAWLAGAAVFGIALALHTREVAQRVGELDRSFGAAWVEFNGPHFVLRTVRMNALVWLTPAWVAAVYLVLALLGLAGWPGETGRLAALTGFGYVAAFCVVGQLDNPYWGWMDTPLLALGAAQGPRSLRDLWRAARGAQAHGPPPVGLEKPLL